MTKHSCISHTPFSYLTIHALASINGMTKQSNQEMRQLLLARHICQVVCTACFALHILHCIQTNSSIDTDKLSSRYCSWHALENRHASTSSQDTASCHTRLTCRNTWYYTTFRRYLGTN